MQTHLFKPFHGGVHPKQFKSLTSESGVTKGFWPRHVFLSLQLRNGAVLKPLVCKGDKVTRGQLVAQSSSQMVAPVHSPVNGIVTAITEHISAHPSRSKCSTIVIRANQDRSWGQLHPQENFYALDPEEIIERIRRAGIVGLGGAGFPTATKLHFARRAKVDTVIINGGECEPYLTCDDLTMRTSSADIIAGTRLIMRASGAKRAIIGVEDNKPAALAQLIYAASDDENISVKSVPSIYPMGSARHLIKAVTGLTVPLGEHVSSVGIVVNNISTTKAVYHAVRYQQPLVSRLLTISGEGINEPCNVEVPFGTPVQEILEFCGGFSDDTERLIFGGPMMGQVITSPHVPIDKYVTGILALTADNLRERPHQECIRCGQCVRACPMGLMPFQIAAYSRISDFNKTAELGVKYCLSCGACSYVCPSNIPLVQYFQHAKGAINAERMKEKKAKQSRVLTEARQQRLAREAEEKRAAKAAKAAKAKARRSPRAKANSEAKEAVND